MIRLLENNVIDKIAAGEVVERPASVVKELVENSLDAEADQITVWTKDGGSIIRITDTGNGIPKNEMKTAFLRHATSKIQTFNDLLNIRTMGFRGEALSSISAVSQMELISKHKEADTASKITVEGGLLTSFSDTGAPPGTTVVVRNLFYNTPARRKFLKSPAAETALIHELIGRLALSRPDVAFRLVTNDKLIFSTNGSGDLKTAVFYVYGKEITNGLIPLVQSTPTISGFVCAPLLTRGNRSYCNFFLNGRFVKSDIVQKAVEDAYKNRLPKGKFPVYIIHMTLPPNSVDVNVHPAKLEVRFDNEKVIYETINKNVENTLSGLEISAVPQIFVAEEIKPYNLETPKKTETHITLLPKNTEEQELPAILENTKEQELPTIIPEETSPASASVPFSDYKIIGQIFDVYWIIEQSGKIFLIDQHAAHERILFEELTDKFWTSVVPSQLLLATEKIKLAPKEAECVREHMELFEKFGFEIKDMGANEFLLLAAPYIFDAYVDESFFITLADKLTTDDRADLFEFNANAIATAACKAAVKANKQISEDECRSLIERLNGLNNPFTCPHGRPTVISMSKYMIEKRFGRV